MLYKISELGKTLGVNKASVYKKIKRLNEELQPYLKYENNVLKINDEGLEILRKSFDKKIVAELPKGQQSDNNVQQSNKKALVFLPGLFSYFDV